MHLHEINEYVIQIAGTVGAVMAIVTFVNKTVIQPYQPRSLKRYRELFEKEYLPRQERNKKEWDRIVSEFSGRMDDLNGNMVNLDKSIVDLNSTVKGLSIEVDTLREKIDDVEEKVEIHGERLARLEGGHK